MELLIFTITNVVNVEKRFDIKDKEFNTFPENK